jgi:hypothetical protein
LSQWFDKTFFRAIYHWNCFYGYDQYNLGVALTVGRGSIGPYAGPASDKCHRYCFYALNLLGDPETPLYKDRFEENGPYELVVTHPGTININPFGAKISVNVQANGMDVDDATVCLWKEDDVYCIKTTNPMGDAVFVLDDIETTEELCQRL